MVKMAPVIGALRRRFPDWRTATVHTGQHYDRLMSEIFLEELGMPEPDHVLGVGLREPRRADRAGPGAATAGARGRTPDLVLVPGDVNSTLGAALCADEAGDRGRPPRIGAAELRPLDA